MKEAFQAALLAGASFAPAEPPDGFGPLWNSYKSDGQGCRGWFHHLSPERAEWSISIHDFVMEGDFVMDSAPHRYLTVTWFKSICGEEFQPYRRLRPGAVWGLSIGGGPWRGVAHGSSPVQCVSIEVTPGFAQNCLAGELAGDDGARAREEEVERAFTALGDSGPFPEMSALLSGLWPRPRGGARSALHYEGKVLEAMGLIVERSRSATNREAKPVAAVDRERMREVALYIDDHCSARLRLADLAAIACMSPTKFKETFKRVNGKTLTQYVQERRMSHAEALLRHSDLTIEQVGRAVGYTCPSRFSALFKREVGVRPSDLRKALSAWPAGEALAEPVHIHADSAAGLERGRHDP